MQQDGACTSISRPFQRDSQTYATWLDFVGSGSKDSTARASWQSTGLRLPPSPKRRPAGARARPKTLASNPAYALRRHSAKSVRSRAFAVASVKEGASCVLVSSVQGPWRESRSSLLQSERNPVAWRAYT
jgi:hypothetical protein